MEPKRKVFSAAFKAKVAVAAEDAGMELLNAEIILAYNVLRILTEVRTNLFQKFAMDGIIIVTAKPMKN